MQHQFDLIVVGGGPAGSVVAAGCARAGLSVALFEHHKFPRHKVCGDVINPNCWPTLDWVGAAGRIRALDQHQITGALFTTSDGTSLDVPMRAQAIRRSLFDAALLSHARACGVVIFEGEPVHDINRTGEVQTCRRRCRARRGIVGADGRHSVVARKLGLARRGDVRNGPIAFQGHFRATPSLDSQVQLHLFPGGYCGVVRVDDDQANVCLVTDRAGAQHHDDCEALFAYTVWQNRQFHALGIDPKPLDRLESAHPLVTPVSTPYRDRVWLVGDALRTTEPFTGQGIFFALRTAELATESICAGRDYASAVHALYDERGRTNALLRRLLYRERVAAPVVRALRHWPGATRWLAGNVLAERPVSTTIARR